MRKLGVFCGCYFSAGDLNEERVCYIGGSGEDEGSDGGEEQEERDIIKEEKWDCESILRSGSGIQKGVLLLIKGVS